MISLLKFKQLRLFGDVLEIASCAEYGIDDSKYNIKSAYHLKHA
jgi:hypothetical protein